MTSETSTTLIEAKTGQDTGSRKAGNGWDKFVVKGLDLVEERVERTNRSLYVSSAVEAENGKVFTVWYDADGGQPFYAICVVDSTGDEQALKGYGGCYIKGKFRVLAQAEGHTYAKRLLAWWDIGTTAQIAKSRTEKEAGRLGVYTRAWQQRYAAHLATQITRRGIKEPAPLADA